jgi:soluble lytic murein transglycosylase
MGAATPPDSEARFERYAAFIGANPEWPSIPLLHRRAEASLWRERRDAVTVHRFLGGEPTSAVGRLALARVRLGEGDRAGAEREVRAVWHSAELSAELEAATLDAFRDDLDSRAHGPAHRCQGLRCGDARCQAPRRP